MSEELGKIEKPEVSSFKKDRRLLQVPLIYSGPESPSDYVEILGRFWQQAGEQIDKLEKSEVKITRWSEYTETFAPFLAGGLLLLLIWLILAETLFRRIP